VGPRVGVDYADEAHRTAPWRVALAGSAWVSKRSTLAPWTEGAGAFLARERLAAKPEEDSAAPLALRAGRTRRS
jgi:hypothetical protein